MSSIKHLTNTAKEAPVAPAPAADSFSPDNSTGKPNDAGSSNGSSRSSDINRYSVAAHTLRITKHGYAINPIELKYSEVINNLSQASRRKSELRFHSNNVAHKILALIRGFWSQPGFPKGRVLRLADATLDAIMNEFDKHPPFPHRETHGNLVVGKMNFNSKSRGKESLRKRSDDLGKNSRTSRVSVSKLIAAAEADNEFANLGSNYENSAMTIPTLSPSIPHSSKQTGGSSAKKKRQKSQATESSNLIASFFGSSKSSKSETHQPEQPPGFISWLPKEKSEIVDLVATLCLRMESVFRNETRILNIPAPCMVLGDIHGNLTDLRTYERSLWPKAPSACTSNYLFLGDYVDRGDFSVECILYLFSMKLLAPTRFYMLRGNHEVAAIQRQYTFSRECEIKFGLSQGKQIWRDFNRVFDLMPIAAVIDDQIFCAHGGIPKSVSNIKQLAKEIPSPLDNPEVQCPSAWEILWNDPITDSELVGMIEMDNAVVTQTQTQTIPDAQQEDGSEANNGIAGTITTSIKATMAPEVTSKSTQDTTQTTGPNNRDQLSEADAILSREPSVALSFYIRPADTNTDQQQQQQTNNKTTGKDIGRAAKDLSNDPNNNRSDSLRTVPSDTSSIASTSPQQIMNDGFVANIKRGTAYLFADQAINNFLKLNQLSHVIRAHEVIPTGFAFHGDGRVITIFSSSKYCGLNNQAACALVDQRRIRIFRLDTGEAGE